MGGSKLKSGGEAENFTAKRVPKQFNRLGEAWPQQKVAVETNEP